jgi:hypothetical protein
MAYQTITYRALLEYFRTHAAVKAEWLWFAYKGEGDIRIRYFSEDGQKHIIRYIYAWDPGVDLTGATQEDETIYWTVDALCGDFFGKEGPGIFTLDVSTGEVRRIASVWYDYEREIGDKSNINFKRYLGITPIPEDKQSSVLI